MRELKLPQGSSEWAAHRATARNASDAPAMMGCSPYVSRAELIRRMATGIVPEVDPATQRRFDRGHEIEPALRSLAESILNEDLFPVVGISDDGYLSASLDGVTMLGDVIAEFKQANAEKQAAIARDVIPGVDYWQIVQQFAVCNTATRCLYLVGDGTEAGTSRLWIERALIERDIQKLRAAWQQFDADVAAYAPEPVKAEVVAAHVAGLGALSLRVEGRVLASNLDVFRADADAFIARLPKPAELLTDQDFANADAAVKACADAEDRIKAARDAAMAQMADVDAVLRTADEVRETIRAARLALDRVVKAEKENRRVELVRAAAEAVRLYYASVAKSLGEYAPDAPANVTADLGAAIKGLKSLASIKDKLDGAVAQIKIAASQDADRRRDGIAVIEAHHEHQNLLPDRVVLVATKSTDDLRNLIAARINEHEAKEQARLDAERVRIREEEAAKLRAAQPAPVTNTVESEAAPEVVAAAPRADQACTTAAADTATTSASPCQPAGFPKPGTFTPSPAYSANRGGARLKLGDINARIAPLSISAQGLAEIGFQPVSSEGAAKLYAESDFAGICNVLSARLQRAVAMQEAA